MKKYNVILNGENFDVSVEPMRDDETKFLGIAFMCYQMPERSFFVRGRQFPLCARCTGIL